MNSGLCVIKRLLEMRKIFLYGSVLIKRDSIDLWGFINTELTSRPVQEILVMWDVLLVNGMMHSSIFLL